MLEKKSLVSRGRQEPLNLLRQMTSELDRMFDEPWTLFRWPSADVASPDAPIWALQSLLPQQGALCVVRFLSSFSFSPSL